jgi:hypothetical protein
VSCKKNASKNVIKHKVKKVRLGLWVARAMTRYRGHVSGCGCSGVGELLDEVEMRCAADLLVSQVRQVTFRAMIERATRCVVTANTRIGSEGLCLTIRKAHAPPNCLPLSEQWVASQAM